MKISRNQLDPYTALPKEMFDLSGLDAHQIADARAKLGMRGLGLYEHGEIYELIQKQKAGTR